MALKSDGSTKIDALPLFEDAPAEHQKDVCCPKLWGPFQILNKYGNQLKRSRQCDSSLVEKLRSEPIMSSLQFEQDGQASTAANIMRRATLIKSLKSDNGQKMSNLFEFHYDIDQKNAKHLKLALCLLDAAECFNNKHYDKAENFLGPILLDSDGADHPVERVVKYFAEDLRERIDEENGKVDLEREVVDVDVHEAFMDMKASIFQCEQKVPFCQISHFTAIQTILDNVASAERIHLIDIGVRVESSYWIVMMHSLANRKDNPIMQLKITAVYGHEQNIERTAEMLSSSADSMDLPFAFKTLFAEMHELTDDHFEMDSGETVVVYLQYGMSCLSPYPKKIEALMQTIKILGPSVMVVREIEANTSGTTFIDRFHEAVFLCSAMFDSYEGCLARKNRFRNISERVYFQEMIRNRFMGPEDGTFNRCLMIKFWREYFARFGIVEMELSQASVCQAGLLAREFACWRHCTLGMNGKCLVLGWDGTPLNTLSAWKFQHD